MSKRLAHFLSGKSKAIIPDEACRTASKHDEAPLLSDETKPTLRHPPTDMLQRNHVNIHSSRALRSTNIMECMAYIGSLKSKTTRIKYKKNSESRVIVQFDLENHLSIFSSDGKRVLNIFALKDVYSVHLKKIKEDCVLLLYFHLTSPLVLVVQDINPIIKALRFCGVSGTLVIEDEGEVTWALDDKTWQNSTRSLQKMTSSNSEGCDIESTAF